MTQHRPTLHKSLPSKRSALDQIADSTTQDNTATQTPPKRKLNISQLVEILTRHDNDPTSFNFEATSERFNLPESDLRKLLAYITLKQQ